MTDSDANAQRITDASRALSAYEESTFDSPSALPSDPIYTQALMAAMLCDLEHYATAHGVDFVEAVSAGRETYADEIAAQKQYEIGDEVQFRLQPRLRGTVIDTSHAPNGDQTYLVKVSGLPYIREEPAVALDNAPPFPPTPTGPLTITRADQAEQVLVDQAARLRGPHTDADRRTYELLLDALADWSGTTTHELLTDLAPRIRQTTSRPSATSAELASHDFPTDITDGVPPAETLRPRQTPPSSPTNGDRRTA
ncbi:hypothetical protein [Actinomadura hibisca]|uniref:hypothetical protein n=1 Tax=Actinomadura hibisca TaxID=68565 RepID=UPI00083453C8|nr:hypothetical protein [Actinomadura hibisca]